jgi:hypothetical protein
MVPPTPLSIAQLIVYKQVVTQLDEPQTGTTNFVTVTMTLTFRDCSTITRLFALSGTC